ncbi:MAG: bifunctional adenosylcobinamide kinase/adenosylcobinamide-phosphate guanylyltransferase [Natronospirillum sp.]
MIHLITGGARSGKSRRAETLAMGSALPVIYIATAQAADAEMAARIAHHRHQRPSEWHTIEEPIQLAQVLQRLPDDHCVLIDCMTLWLSNLLHAEPGTLEREANAFLEHLATTSQYLIIVTNEVGSGIIPLGELSRQFADEAGRLNQQLGRLADQAELIVAGLPVFLK